MASLLAYLRATHPVPAFAVTAIAGVLLWARGASGRELALGVLCAGAGQASVGWSNDYFDRERDRRAGRREKPIVSDALPARSVQVAAFAAAGTCVAAGAALGVGPALAMSAAVASAWAYNLGLKATWLSWAPYAISFALLTIFAGLATGTAPPVWIPVGASILGVAAHLMNALPDLEADRGMRGLPHRLGRAGSLVLAATLMGVGLVLAVAAARAWQDARSASASVLGLVLVVAAVVAPTRGRLRAGFTLSIAAAAAVVAVVVLGRARW